MTRTVILGPEYDSALRSALADVLRQMGAQLEHRKWGVGGSQELETLKVVLRGRQLEVEAETYIGLSLTGDEELVNEIEQMVRAQLARK